MSYCLILVLLSAYLSHAPRLLFFLLLVLIEGNNSVNYFHLPCSRKTHYEYYLLLFLPPLFFPCYFNFLSDFNSEQLKALILLSLQDVSHLALILLRALRNLVL